MTTLFHNSPRENRDSILKHGLLCSKSTADAGAIYFSTKQTPQCGFDIWAVESSEIAIEPDLTTDAPKGEDWCVTYRNIHPQHIKLVAMC